MHFYTSKCGDRVTDLELPKLQMKNNPYNFLSKFWNIRSKFSIEDRILIVKKKKLKTEFGIVLLIVVLMHIWNNFKIVKEKGMENGYSLRNRMDSTDDHDCIHSQPIYLQLL